jgi:hypothetical protein
VAFVSLVDHPLAARADEPHRCSEERRSVAVAISVACPSVIAVVAHLDELAVDVDAALLSPKRVIVVRT